MAFELRTLHGHNMYDMSSMLQKAIRRENYELAGYAANELYQSFRTYLWKRLLVISAEDCYGIITKEIVGLKLADDQVNGTKKNGDTVFVAKAVTLLCQARKNRDACYFACNFMNNDTLIPEEQIEHVDITKCQLGTEGIPDWVFDVHTIRGKKQGKTDLDMIKAEQEALKPLQISIFDFDDWKPCYDHEKGMHGPKELRDLDQFIKDCHDKKVKIIKECYKNGDVIGALKGVADYKLCDDVNELETVKYAYELLRSNRIIKQCGDDADGIISDGLYILDKVLK